mmetsp:Transcript_175292/g.562217  ORF Transcript_175292/g.562217 Transcript_175292/m.562217 type:complete len:352 (+) Transcript_175292:145-1200(+)
MEARHFALHRASKGAAPPAFITMPDGSIVRGAKKGGMTDHIAGPHMIPNVGREAMVPAECVRRKPKAKARSKVEPPKLAPKVPAWAPKKEVKGKKKEGRRERSRSRSRKRRRDDGSEGDASAGSDAGSPRTEGVSPPAVRLREPTEEERQLAFRREKEAKEASSTSMVEAREREDKRLQEELKKLKEMEEARKRKEDLDKARKQKLNGMFAFGDDDEEGDDSKARVARERQLADDRRRRGDRLVVTGETIASSSSSLRGDSSTLAVTPSMSSTPRLATSGSVTALDIDGVGHDHKFSKVWKDWDASKKDDPGEIARQFMKVAQIKRRGYSAPSAGSRGGRSRSRSRSRGRR